MFPADATDSSASPRRSKYHCPLAGIAIDPIRSPSILIVSHRASGDGPYSVPPRYPGTAAPLRPQLLEAAGMTGSKILRMCNALPSAELCLTLGLVRLVDKTIRQSLCFDPLILHVQPFEPVFAKRMSKSTGRTTWHVSMIVSLGHHTAKVLS